MITPVEIIAFIVTYMFIHIVLFYLISPKFQLNLDLYLGKLKYLLSFILALIAPVTIMSIIGLCVVLFFISVYKEWTLKVKVKKEDELRLQESKV